MGYWNRDRDEPFRCWHDECFPVTLPPFWKVSGYTSLRESIQMRFDSLTDAKSYLRDVGHYERHVETMTRRVTPDGYAWAPWLMGADCETCGKAA